MFESDGAADLNLTLTNTGQGPLTVHEASFEQPNSRLVVLGLGLPVTIESGATKSFSVRLLLNQLGVIEEALRLDAPTVEGGRYRTVPITGEIVPGEVTMTPPVLNFGEEFQGYPKEMTVTLENTGTVSIELEGLEGLAESAFSWVSPPAFPITLSPGESVDWQLTFTPEGPGTFSKDLVVSSNLHEDPMLQVTGVGKIAPGLTVFNENDEKLNLGETLLLGDVRVSESRTVSLRIGNDVAEGTMVVSEVYLTEQSNEDFSLSFGSNTNFPVSLVTYNPNDPATYIEVNVTYAPSAINLSPQGGLESVLGSISISSDDPTSPITTLGMEVRPIDPVAEFLPVVFGDVLVASETKTATLSVTNTGHGPLTLLSAAWFDDGQSNPFSLGEYDPTPILRNETRELSVMFQPETETGYSKVLELNFSDGLALKTFRSPVQEPSVSYRRRPPILILAWSSTA